MMRYIRRSLPLISFQFVNIVGLALFLPVVETRVGEQISNKRKLQRTFRGHINEYQLDRCRGNCDIDAHCKGDLICFHRQGSELVPGCRGGEKDTTPTNYCIDPKHVVSEHVVTEKKHEVSEKIPYFPELKWLGQNPSARHFPLQECEGDCDTNRDCDSGLICLQRRYENSGPVPGCWGRDNSLADYCVKDNLVNSKGKPQPAKAPPPPPPPPKPTRSFESTTITSPPKHQFEVIENFGLKMYWEPHYMWQEENFDRRWCMECYNGECDYGDKTYIHTCERAISQRYDFIRVNDSFTMIRLHKTNLCFERISMDIFLYDCDLKNRRQFWVGDFRLDRFEIKPLGLDSHCVTQRHHPKFYEEVEIEPCEMARSSHTSFWTLY